MHTSLLRTLRCPFCGTALEVVDNQALSMDGDGVATGVLGCQCCAFPIVEGIPVLLADDRTRDAIRELEAGRADHALFLLLGLDDDAARRHAFAALRSRPTATYRDAQAVLSPDAEGTYFIYRFSDPTYLTSSAVLRAVASATRPRRVIDVCGGTGHLTRDLQAAARTASVVLADLYYWKLWLAQTYIEPRCHPVCCDGNAPLPFARGSFDFVSLSDAFPYIWHKRLLADELVRLTSPGGVLVMPHLHSSLGFNYSAGMTLTPAAYADLFSPLGPRVFKDSELLDGVLERAEVDLQHHTAPEDMGEEPSFTLVATGAEQVFSRHGIDLPGTIDGDLVINPLYRVERSGTHMVLTLSFPTEEYADEFRACRRYLPESVVLDTADVADLTQAGLGARYDDLRRRRVILDAPRRYC